MLVLTLLTVWLLTAAVIGPSDELGFDSSPLRVQDPEPTAIPSMIEKGTLPCDPFFRPWTVFLLDRL